MGQGEWECRGKEVTPQINPSQSPFPRILWGGPVTSTLKPRGFKFGLRGINQSIKTINERKTSKLHCTLIFRIISVPVSQSTSRIQRGESEAPHRERRDVQIPAHFPVFSLKRKHSLHKTPSQTQIYLLRARQEHLDPAHKGTAQVEKLGCAGKKHSENHERDQIPDLILHKCWSNSCVAAGGK